MGAQPPNQAGQLSPDGMWRWDGRQWVPTGQVAKPHQVPRSRAWLWWAAGGCGVLLVIGAAGAAYGMVSALRSFQQGGLSCLPSDLPRYPGSTVSSEATDIGPSGHVCRMSFESNDPTSTVRPYFESHLKSGDWTIVSEDLEADTITFSKVSRPQVHGTVKVLPSSRGTHLEVVLNS